MKDIKSHQYRLHTDTLKLVKGRIYYFEDIYVLVTAEFPFFLKIYNLIGKILQSSAICK